MKTQSGILSSASTPAGSPGREVSPLLIDACSVAVVLRALVLVVVPLALVSLYQAVSLLQGILRFALLTGVALPATLLWLLGSCSARRWLLQRSRRGQAVLAMLWGALCGWIAVLLWLRLGWSGNVLSAVAGVGTGACLSGLLIANTTWRRRSRMPAGTQARLSELQARIRPHFLFNTLNTAIALVRDEPARAEAVLEDLAELFQRALAEPGDHSTLAEELRLACRYLEIEQLRFGSRLQLQWDLDPAVNGVVLPPLALQPIVENAVRHGVEPSPDGAWIWIRSMRRRGLAIVEVCNTVPAGQGRDGLGLALDNVRDRLRLLHDLESSFSAELKDGVFRVRMEIPMRTHQAPALASGEES